MSYLTDITAARDSLVTELKTETAYRATNGPKPTYQLNGRQVHWNEWLAGMLAAIKSANDLVAAGDPANGDALYEVPERGYT